MSSMTKIDGVPDRETAKPGMAFFSGTGPQGATCGGCQWRGYMRQRRDGRGYNFTGCYQFKKLTGHPGPPIQEEYAACKYFEPDTRSKK